VLASRRGRFAALMLAAWLAAFVFSNRWFAFIDDEIIDINTAGRPLADTIGRFASGRGFLEHPPLAEILLHFWLPIAGSSPVLLRLPFALLYVGGLLLLARAAGRLLPTIALGVLSPFAFHFARLAGWYLPCFFLVAWLTLAWLRYREAPGRLRLAFLILPAILLTWTNYYGWVMVGLLLLGLRAVRPALVAFGVIVVANLPLTTSFLAEIRGRSHPAALTSNLMLGSFDFYSLFVSESVAPWFWYLSIPAGIAIAVVLMSVWRQTFFRYFAVAFAGLVLAGGSDNKRLLFLTAWLILGIATAPLSRRLLISLSLIAVLGWTGILTRRWYSAPHFIEPWAEVADRATAALRQGDVVVSNSPPFLFTLNKTNPNVYDIRRWIVAPPPRPVTVLFVEGVNQNLNDLTARVADQFRSECALLESSRLVPDSGSALKRKFFPQLREPPFRILIDRYRCP